LSADAKPSMIRLWREPSLGHVADDYAVVEKMVMVAVCSRREFPHSQLFFTRGER
jgi:hypothetical protein